MPVTPFAPVAFRCKNCGRLHEAGHAGDADHPHACRVCGAGVSFDPRTGQKALDPENWEVLADAPPERLEELGLASQHVEQHAPPQRLMPGQVAPRQVEAGAQDGPRSQDRP